MTTLIGVLLIFAVLWSAFHGLAYIVDEAYRQNERMREELRDDWR